MPSITAKSTINYSRTVNLKVISWNITNPCNMDCLHSYLHSESDDRKNELSFNQPMEAVRKLPIRSVESLFLSDGEPFMVPHLFELIEEIYKRSISDWIWTNGRLINGPEVNCIISFGVLGVSVSVDGSEPVIYDRLRNHNNANKKALRTIQLLSENFVTVYVS